jgi:hypothetical protein
VALAIDAANSPPVVTNAVGGTATVTTASFTPPSGSLLLILWSGNSSSGSNPAAPTITDNLGVHLTYTQTDWQSRANSPTVNGQAAAWWAVVGSSAAMTVTVTNGDSTNHQAALAVVVLTGQHATPIGAHSKSGSASAASIAQSYTAQATGGWGFLVSCDWDALGTDTAGTGCTLLPSGSGTIPTTQISYAFERRTTADDSNGVSNTLNLTLPGTSTNLSWVYVEVVPAAATLTYPPYWEGRRRLLSAPGVTRRRGGTPTRAQVPPPQLPLIEVKQPRRLRGLLPRHGHAFMPVPAQVVLPPPPYPPQGLRTRLRFARVSRGHAATPVPAQVTPPPLVYVPQAVRGRLKLPSIRRHDNAQPTIDQAVPLPQAVRSRPKPRPTRGHIAAPAQPQAAAPLFTRFKRRLARIFRGKPVTVVPPQVIVIPPSYAVQAVRARRNQFAARRHRGGVDGWMVPGVHLCVTPRPNTGTTTYATATTARPASGTTAYNTATTARPNTGTTQDPC